LGKDFVLLVLRRRIHLGHAAVGQLLRFLFLALRLLFANVLLLLVFIQRLRVVAAPVADRDLGLLSILPGQLRQFIVRFDGRRSGPAAAGAASGRRSSG